MNILVCGGRDFNRQDVFMRVIESVLRTTDPEFVEFVSGMAKGADSMVVEFAEIGGYKVHKFPADWDTHGKVAGGIRNQQMLDETPGGVDLVIAFPTKNSRGTWDMVRRAEKAGIKTIVVKEEA